MLYATSVKISLMYFADTEKMHSCQVLVCISNTQINIEKEQSRMLPYFLVSKIATKMPQSKQYITGRKTGLRTKRSKCRVYKQALCTNEQPNDFFSQLPAKGQSCQQPTLRKLNIYMQQNKDGWILLLHHVQKSIQNNLKT